MSPIALRATEDRDLPRISELTEAVFGRRRDVELLRWLLGLERGAASRGPVESWVAERDGEVVGHGAILSSNYLVDGQRQVGKHPYLWMVLAEQRGPAGMKLGRVIIGSGDFQVVLGGSALTKAIVSKRRFAAVTEAREYRLLEEPRGAAKSRAATDFDLAEANEAPSPPARAPAGGKTVIVNEASDEHLAWLAACPELEAHRLTLIKGGEPQGPVLVYVNRQETPAAGRLVHLPYLGDRPEIWSGALARIGRAFADWGCASWTLLATHPALASACEKAGAEIVATRPVWLREQGEIPGGRDGHLWHLTYLEGDLAYRRVENPVAVGQLH